MEIQYEQNILDFGICEELNNVFIAMENSYHVCFFVFFIINLFSNKPINQLIYFSKSVPLDVPQSFISNIVQKRLEQNRQQDAGEFLIFLLDQLSSELESMNRTDIRQDFELYLKQTIECKNCNHKVYQTVLQSMIFLTISHSSIEKSLSRYLSNEFIDDYKCEKCYNIGVWQENALLGKFPKYFYIQFKIFNNSLEKISNQIEFELEKDIVFFGNQYTLNSIIIHIGSSLRHGHYCAYIRRGKKWFICNDEEVQIADIKKINTSNIYMMCYVDSIEPSNFFVFPSLFFKFKCSFNMHLQ